MSDSRPFYRTVRSFVKREGKITVGQQKAIDELWPVFGVDALNSLIDWPALFGREAPVNMEIGFGNGLSLADMAQAAPKENFFGVEVHKPGLGSLLVQIKQRGLQNVRVSGGDAVEVLRQVPESSLNRLQIFFPDPWHKKRHHKRRLIQDAFITEAILRLKQKGILHVATDWQHYAEQVIALLSVKDGLENLSEQYYSVKPDYRPETKYERRGLKLGHRVWDILFQKTA